jgi:hypothetical protein
MSQSRAEQHKISPLLTHSRPSRNNDHRTQPHSPFHPWLPVYYLRFPFPNLYQTPSAPPTQQNTYAGSDPSGTFNSNQTRPHITPARLQDSTLFRHVHLLSLSANLTAMKSNTPHLFILYGLTVVLAYHSPHSPISLRHLFRIHVPTQTLFPLHPHP